MAQHQVSEYALAWNAGANRGLVNLRLENGAIETIDADSADLAALDAILRSNVAFFDIASRTITTGWKVPGP